MTVEKVWINHEGRVVIREKLPYSNDRDPQRQFKKLRDQVWEKSGGICGGCDKPADKDDWEADHRKAHVSGGRTTVENGQVMHPKCNREKWDSSDRTFGDTIGEAATEAFVEEVVGNLVDDLMPHVYKGVKNGGVAVGRGFRGIYRTVVKIV